MIRWPDALVREIADRRALIFVGAGLSKAASNVMPSWVELLQSFYPRLKGVDQKLVKRLIHQGRLLDAAQIITDGVNRADFDAVLLSRLQLRPTPAHECTERYWIWIFKIFSHNELRRVLREKF